MNEKKPVYIYNRENLATSLISDTITYGSFIGLMFLNFEYWGGRWYVTVFLLFVWFMALIGRANNRIHRFYNARDCIDFIKKDSKL